MITTAQDGLNLIFDRYACEPSRLVEVLLDIQETEGYLSKDTMCRVSDRLGIPPIEVYRVANFYKAFSLTPRGRHIVTACTGTACHVRGSQRLLDEVAGQLGIQPDETTEDGLFTLERVNCLGACALGPVVVIDGIYHHHVTPGKLRRLLKKIRDAEEEAVENV